MTSSGSQQVGLLLSGGLDSAILLGTLLGQGCTVQPIYVRSHLHWEPAELQAVERFLAAVDSPRLERLVLLEQPVGDLYGPHWSVTGRLVPDHQTPDESVYLPGRNMLLITKAGLWCQLHDIGQLALAVLGSNPFPDATDEFFATIARCLSQATGKPLTVLRPFAQLDKREVMQLGAHLPLALTFSCIDPQGGQHCGMCNKCGERKLAFRTAAIDDPTEYAGSSHPGNVETDLAHGAASSSSSKRRGE